MRQRLCQLRAGLMRQVPSRETSPKRLFLQNSATEHSNSVQKQTVELYLLAQLSSSLLTPHPGQQLDEPSEEQRECVHPIVGAFFGPFRVEALQQVYRSAPAAMALQEDFKI